MRHVVVDARMAWASGIGTYVRNVVPRVVRLVPDWRFTIIVGDGPHTWAEGDNARVVTSTAGIYSVREQVELALRTPADADLFWATHYNFPLLRAGPSVVTIHDLGHLRLSEYTSRPARRLYARMMFSLARRRAAGLLFVSRFARDEFRDLVGSSNAIDAVVHHGVDAAWFEPTRDTPPLTQPYFVYVGNIKPHKNLHVLLDAFERVRDRLGAQLVIIGRDERFRTPDRTIAARVATMPHVAMVGELDEVQLRRYVRHATALVLPSLYEGFGLPPLEAMAAGCPAIVSSAGSLPEVCGEGAAYFDPRDAAALADLLARSATDAAFSESLRSRGRAHVRGFDWDASARGTQTLLAKALVA